MIYYDVQHHGSTEHLSWLAKQLSDDGSNLVNISLDKEHSSITSFRNQVGNDIANLQIEKSIPISWCGPSQMAQQMHMLSSALKQQNWDYFINLSGSCYPLKSQSYIKSQLRKCAAEGITSFCYSFLPKKASLWLERNLELDCNYTNLKYLRLNLTCDKAVSNALSNNEFDPVRSVMHRRGVHCTEDPINNSLTLRGLYQHEKEGRKKFWDENPYMVGRAWVILSRKQVEWIVSTDFTYELYNQLSQTFEPDETFFPSLLFNKRNPFISELSRNNFRYKLGAPEVIDSESLINSFASDAFFARKLSYTESFKTKILNFILDS